MRFKFGTWAAQLKTGALTAVRSWNLPDRSGEIALMPAQSAANFSSVVSFDMSFLAYASQAVTSQIDFTVGGGTKYAGARVLYKLVANGNTAHVPTFTGMTKTSDSVNYDNRAGIVNVVEILWDGAAAWYRIWQPEYALPTFQALAITFSLRSASPYVPNNAGNTYSSPAAEGDNYTSRMSSDQSIPAGKAGRITFVAHPQGLVGFSNTRALESFTDMEYVTVGASNGFIITGVGGLNGAYTAIQSTFAGPTGSASLLPNTGVYQRLTRSSNGQVTAEASLNGTSWTLVRTFAQTYTGQLFINVNMSGNGSNRNVIFVSFELEP